MFTIHDNISNLTCKPLFRNLLVCLLIQTLFKCVVANTIDLSNVNLISGMQLKAQESLSIANDDDYISEATSLNKEMRSNMTFQSIIDESSQDRRLQSTADTPIVNQVGSASINLYIYPDDGFFSPTALGVFMRAETAEAKVYYTIDGDSPTLSSRFLTYDSPYLHIDTPYLTGRNRTVRAVAAYFWIDGNLYRSEEVVRHYIVEAAARPHSYGFLIPGVEGQGYFLRVGLEMAAAARAQVSGKQEFADFNTYLGYGPYSSQLTALHLPSIDPDLLGFEGGFPANVSGGQFGFLVPYHNNKRFFGKVVRINLLDMENTTICISNVRSEKLEADGTVTVTGVALQDACVAILDLESIHVDARGFRRGFAGPRYAYLAPGQFDVAVRLDLRNFGISTTKILALGDIQNDLGGYSGGFVDGNWACFCPLRTFLGPIGGVRSNLDVDKNRLTAYHHGLLVCVNQSAWTTDLSVVEPASLLGKSVRTIDLSSVGADLRGFSDAIAVGRFAYLCPFATEPHAYTSKLVRIDLGVDNIISNLDRVKGFVGDMVDVLDLTQADPGLAGFSGIFNSGKYLYLVPWRNEYVPYNGQRGHGLVPRIDMNIFDSVGVTTIDTSTTTRSQIPSFADIDLVGFSFGFASGQYGLLVPFYNGIFSGKIGRINALSMDSVQEVDLMKDRWNPNVYRGFRGGFVNLWQGTPEDIWISGYV